MCMSNTIASYTLKHVFLKLNSMYETRFIKNTNIHLLEFYKSRKILLTHQNLDILYKNK